MSNKTFLDSIGVKHLWDKITTLIDKKIDSVEGDDSIQVVESRKISVRISSAENNLFKVKPDGVYVAPPVLHKLTFGAGEEYTYDGTKDVVVPVYDGSYEINT